MSITTISSIYSNMILPYNKFHLPYHPGRLLLLETTKTLQVNWEQKSKWVSSGIILGQEFELINFSSISVKVNGIIINSPFSYKAPNNIFFPRRQQIELILKLFNLTEISQSSINQAEEQLYKLCRYLLEKPKCSEVIDTNSSHKRLHGKIDNRLIMIHRYIRQNYSHPLTLKILADIIGCNPTYLSNSFTKVFKISPMSYLKTIRMKKASELLKNTKMSIKEIAISLGYISNSQFSSTFKQYYSCTPVKYRQKSLIEQAESEVAI
ncbi:helix-turn-helix transcriptional regulator [Bacillus mojavensis]|nr:helix-turn-helix transcriptional regulator [Bacillus mojavensis]